MDFLTAAFNNKQKLRREHVWPRKRLRFMKRKSTAAKLAKFHLKLRWKTPQERRSRAAPGMCSRLQPVFSELMHRGRTSTRVPISSRARRGTTNQGFGLADSKTWASRRSADVQPGLSTCRWLGKRKRRIPCRLGRTDRRGRGEHLEKG